MNFTFSSEKIVSLHQFGSFNRFGSYFAKFSENPQRFWKIMLMKFKYNVTIVFPVENLSKLIWL